jgi:4-amino-4-deoxy-L-arabinose transferase-like glycosyltransferase
VSQTSRVRDRERGAPAGFSPLRRWMALPGEAKLFVVTLALAALLRLWPLGGLSTDYDEGVYWQSLRALAQGHALFAQTFSSQPPAFLLSIFPIYLLFGQSLVAARLSVALFSLAGLVGIYFAGKGIGGRWAGGIACVLLAVDPLYLIESRTLQAEVPALAFALTCVALAVAASKRQGRERLWLAAASGVALGLGVMTKLFDVVALVPALLYLAAPIGAAIAAEGQPPRPPTRAELVDGVRASVLPMALFAAGALLTCALVLLPFAAHWGALYDQVVRFHLAAGHAVNRGLGYNVRLIAGRIEEYPLALAALVPLALALWQRRWRVVPPALWLLASLLVLLDQQPLFDHHLALLAPPLALTAGVGLSVLVDDAMWQRMTRGVFAARAGLNELLALLLVVVMLCGLGFGTIDAHDASKPLPTNEQRLVLALERLTPPGDVVVTDDQYAAALADRDVPPQLVDTSQVRIESRHLTAAQLERIITASDARVILFASGRFDLVPGFASWVRAHFTLEADFGNGQALYMAQPSVPVPV